MLDLQTIKGIVCVALAIVIVVSVVMLVYSLIQLVICNRDIRKLKQAMQDLDTMPIDDWEAKWGDYIQKKYEECDDPHRQEVEEDMEFFRKELEELKKEDDNANIQQ